MTTSGLKTLLDMTLAAAILVLCAPLLLCIMLIIKLDSPGKIIFAQNRTGQDKRQGERRLRRQARYKEPYCPPDTAERRRQERRRRDYHGGIFKLYKFRTMYENARSSEADGQVMVDEAVSSEDSSITRAGAFLRRFSLDEMPQLINVLKGEMSLVGPRPTIPGQTEKYDDRSRIRQRMKPGLTGLSQVSGRNRLTWREKIEKDIEYVESWSLALDLKIILKTFKVVFGAEDIY